MATSSSVGFAAAIGGLAGASLAAPRGAGPAARAALLGAVGLGTSEAVARSVQKEGEIPPLWQRIAVSTALAAPLGWAAGKLTTAGPRTTGTATGAVVGAMGLRPQKVAMGPVVGAAVGQALGRSQPSTALVASATVLVHRTLSALVFRDAQLSLVADGLGAAELPFVVPRPARSKRPWRRSLAPGTPPTPRASASSHPSAPSRGLGSRSRRWTRSSGSSTSTRPGSPSTSRPSGARGCAPATSSTARSSLVRWARPASR